VSSHYEFRQLSQRRKVVLAFAALWFVAFVAWFLPYALRQPPQSWSPAAVLLCVGWCALSTAIVVIEMIRGALPATSAWTDEKHFRMVMFTSGVFFVIQVAGVLLVLSS